MPQLVYLMEEISAGMEIFYSSRLGGRYLKTAFILCDDYVELLSKLWLVENVIGWKETKGGRFKSFPEILNEVGTNMKGNCHSNEYQRILELTKQMDDRRKRRNDFFHSTQLLDLNVNKQRCVEAFCDLTEFGELLFGDNWRMEIESNTKTNILCTLFQLDKKGFSNSEVDSGINRLLATWPRREKETDYIRKKGTQFVMYPEDLHLRLCLDWGGREFRDALKALLLRFT